MSERLSRPAVFAALAIVSGSVTGLAASFVGARYFAAKPAPAPTYVATHERVAEPGVAIDPRVAGLESRLAMLEARPAGSASAAPAPADPTKGPPIHGAGPEEAQRRADRFHEAVAAHDKEPVDPSWARGANASFSKTLTSLGEAGGFKVIGVDCRTTTCSGTLQFATPEAAQSGYRAVLHAPYDVNCRRRVLLEPSSDPSAGPRATALFDCEEARASGK